MNVEEAMKTEAPSGAASGLSAGLERCQQRLRKDKDMDIEQEAKDLCEQCQNGASISDVMEIVGRIAEQAAAAEREACAMVAENFDFNDRQEIEPPRNLPRYVAAAIRKRSNARNEGADAGLSRTLPLD